MRAAAEKVRLARALGTSLLVIAAAVSSACTSPAPAPPPTASPATGAAAASSPTSSAPSSPPAPLGNGPRLSTGLESARDACNVDSDCQLIATCRCDNCIASRKMHVELCPEPCKADACAGQKPRCAGGACASDQPMADAPGPEVMDAASKAGQLVLDNPRFVAYVHAKERPERLPMVIAWEPGVPRPTWSVGGKPANMVEGLPKDALVPRMVSVNPESARFQFDYAPEGISMTALVARKGGVWTIVGLEIVER